jgi:hypothetical protein
MNKGIQGMNNRVHLTGIRPGINFVPTIQEYDPALLENGGYFFPMKSL